MKLTLISLLLIAVIIAFGILCRARLIDFCDSADAVLSEAKNALDAGDLPAAARAVRDASSLCDRRKNLMQIYLNHSYYNKLKEKLSSAEAFILAGDIKSAYSEIAIIKSQLENLRGYDDIVPGNVF